MSGRVLFAEHDGVYIFKCTGDLNFSLCPAVETFVQGLFAGEPGLPVVVDMTETSAVDSTAMGVIAQIAIQSRRQQDERPILLVSPGDVLVILKSMCFDRVFTILPGQGPEGGAFAEIEPVAPDKKEMLEHILSAHRTLMSLSDENREKFSRVIAVLEKERAGGSTTLKS
jgi:anti-anti-sigma factor